MLQLPNLLQIMLKPARLANLHFLYRCLKEFTHFIKCLFYKE
jgi:hypothetical protein